ncbi:hypothetical protein B0H15DRAFT_143419 [Mycena belliarum]|uniref:Uncharacterized protein n=1 Tax=Mycena belliarum TaxID=1033014 RepID=A0AAD6XT67_9AGAR|nr:hypothetical protein B0H15DRAFT_143419 [Mycena belliae]
MARLITSAVLLLATAMAATACKWCQCLNDSGGHCCVYTTGSSDTDCASMCAQVHDANGNRCSASSLSYKCATLPECNDRSHCRESHACLT